MPDLMHHPVVRAPVRARDWARRRRGTHLALKAFVGLLGTLLVAAGLAMLVLPGPGWAAILLGLLVLASEFEAAERVRHRLAVWLRERADQVKERIRTKG